MVKLYIKLSEYVNAAVERQEHIVSTTFKKKYSRLEIVKKEYNLLEFKEGVTCRGLQSIFMNMK